MTQPDHRRDHGGRRSSQPTPSGKLPSWFDKLSPLTILLVSLIVAELLTAVIVIGFSFLFRGEIAPDYLITGAVTCGVVATLIVTIVQGLTRRLEAGRRRLEETQQQLDTLQQQLQQAQKLEAVGKLAGGVAHDFNNLLGGILGNVTYLRDTPPGDMGHEELQEVLVDVQEAAERGAKLANQLLTFSRRDPGETTSVAASTIVEAVLRLQRRTLDKSITVRTDISPDLWVLGNASRLEQVIMNLCLNARDAMPEGGDLSVRARPAQVAGHALVDDGDYVEIQVSDTGSGMDAEAAERAFEPFFTRKGPGGGSGLGLAVVYGIVQSHRGFVELRTAQGEGSTFVVTLPSAEPLARADAFEARPRAEGAGVEVLLVDDEDGFRRATKRQLIQRGYRVQSARNGEEAVGIAKADPRRFSVVMLDLVMPGLDGEQTYAALRAAGLEAPVLLMSGYEGGHRVQRILDGGAAAFLRKPFTPGVMDDALRNLRATHRADHSA